MLYVGAAEASELLTFLLLLRYRSQDWLELKDPNSGRAYFFNMRTQEVSWVKPRVEVQQREERKPEGRIGDGDGGDGGGFGWGGAQARFRAANRETSDARDRRARRDSLEAVQSGHVGNAIKKLFSK